MRTLRRIAAALLCVALLAAVLRYTDIGGGTFFLRAKDAALFSSLLTMPEGGISFIKGMAAPAVPTVNEDDIPHEAEDTGEEETSSDPASSGSTSSEPLPETAAGKIIEKYFSPYTAKLSYNKIYVRNSTSVNLDIQSELAAGLALKINGDPAEPQVLIMHTHTTESYMQEDRDYYTASDNPRTQDPEKSVVRVGEEIKKQLEAAGIGVLHDQTLHDYPSYTNSYFRSEATVKNYLAKYPSIKVVLDVHRDAMASGDSDKIKPAVEINGKKAAQVMLVMGCQDGSVKGHPNWRENLRLALRVQQTFEVMYPKLARPLYFVPKKYNQHLTTGSMLIEIGSDANTLEEAIYSGEMVGKALASTLETLKK